MIGDLGLTDDQAFQLLVADRSRHDQLALDFLFDYVSLCGVDSTTLFYTLGCVFKTHFGVGTVFPH